VRSVLVWKCMEKYAGHITMPLSVTSGFQTSEDLGLGILCYGTM
jgi:hypothetical protein